MYGHLGGDTTSITCISNTGFQRTRYHYGGRTERDREKSRGALVTRQKTLISNVKDLKLYLP